MAVFSIAGRQDEFGFANVEAQLPALEKTLGRENVSVKITVWGMALALGQKPK